MSTDEIKVCKSVLKKYSEYIVHMRQQYHSQPIHFGVVLGAGTGKGLGFPDWDALVVRLAQTNDLKDLGFVLDPQKDVITNVQRLFQLFKARAIAQSSAIDAEYNKIEMVIRARWQEIVHDALYVGIPESIKALVPPDYYLWSFIEIIKKIPLTINYNFDDTIQRMLASIRTDEEKENTRGYTTIWNTNVYMYPKGSVIYHPNGYLPRNLHEHPSEQLVFLEESFADQLIESITGCYSVLESYFAHNTCLLIGLSLRDPTIKHILRNNAVHFPGNYHYYIQYMEEGEEVVNEGAITDANFDVYNLVTLFLKDKEINALGKLLTMSEEDFARISSDSGLRTVYRYILVGAVAVGKSTAISYFRSLITIDEWLEPMPDEMEKDPSIVEEIDIEKIDKWIAEQWGKKNFRINRMREGVLLVDRGPLDAFAFTKKGEWVKKAELTINGIRPEKSDVKLCSACILFLKGDPKVMAVRAIAKHRNTDATKLDNQQEVLQYVYTTNMPGVRIINTTNKSKAQIVKEIARVIYLSTYEEALLDERLTKIKEGTFSEYTSSK